MVGFVYRICRLLVGCCDIERISAIESGGSKENKKKNKTSEFIAHSVVFHGASPQIHSIHAPN